MNLNDVYLKYYKDKIDKKLFQEVLSYDPTAHNNMGKYGKWLIERYVQKNIKHEDLYKVKEYLSVFDKNKVHIKKENKSIDINQYKTPQDIFRIIKHYTKRKRQKMTASEIERWIKQKQTYRLYEDKNWLVVVPKTVSSARLYGKETEWCTAADRSENMFKEYSYGNTCLFIIINKKKGDKYQYHITTGQFMDENDYSVDDMAFLPAHIFTCIVNYQLDRFNEKKFFRGDTLKKHDDLKHFLAFKIKKVVPYNRKLSYQDKRYIKVYFEDLNYFFETSFPYSFIIHDILTNPNKTYNLQDAGVTDIVLYDMESILSHLNYRRYLRGDYYPSVTDIIIKPRKVIKLFCDILLKEEDIEVDFNSSSIIISTDSFLKLSQDGNNEITCYDVDITEECFHKTKTNKVVDEIYKTKIAAPSSKMITKAAEIVTELNNLYWDWCK